MVEPLSPPLTRQLVGSLVFKILGGERLHRRPFDSETSGGHGWQLPLWLETPI